MKKKKLTIPFNVKALLRLIFYTFNGVVLLMVVNGEHLLCPLVSIATGTLDASGCVAFSHEAFTQLIGIMRQYPEVKYGDLTLIGVEIIRMGLLVGSKIRPSIALFARR